MINNHAALERFKEYIKENNYKLNEIGDKVNKRIILNINSIRDFNKELSDFILTSPEECIPFFEDELSASIGFKGAFGRHLVTPRNVKSSFLSKLICCEGIVTSISVVRPKINKSIHFDEIQKVLYEKDYRDSTMTGNLPLTDTIYPTTHENRPLIPEYGLSDYQDFQTISLQEMPENAPPGQLPRSMECILNNDLVDAVKPGDRVKACGIFKSIIGLHKGTEVPTRFRTIMVLNSIENIQNNEAENDLDEKDIELLNIKIKMLSESPIKFKAIAPTIFGNDSIKKALALQMVGGNELIMRNKSKVRGDINILLIGDPSTAKSQLLRYMLKFNPFAIATTGKGSTGVGLTAAVIVDKETGDKRLEAGAMVLADKGLICIDEFDKMDDGDRVAIHEVMEQQTISISKAGIHTTLNARCSVLAAANPIYGRYDRKLSPQENVRFPESLMTRFDLIFITLDGEIPDEIVSNHVLKMHTDEILPEQEELVSQSLFKEYIAYAKSLKPKLRSETAKYISHAYSKMREEKNSKDLVINITPRLLETIIRLATAHAKLRLSSIVEEEDAEEAIKLINFNKGIVGLYKKGTKRKVGGYSFGNVNYDAELSTQSQKKENVEKITQKEIESDLQGDSKGMDLSIKDEDLIEESNHVDFSQKRDLILELIWSWKEDNMEAEFCSIKDLSKLKNIDFNEIKKVAEELAAQDIIMLDEDNIYFLE